MVDTSGTGLPYHFFCLIFSIFTFVLIGILGTILLKRKRKTGYIIYLWIVVIIIIILWNIINFFAPHSPD